MKKNKGFFNAVIKLVLTLVTIALFLQNLREFLTLFFLAGLIGAYYFSKRKPNQKRKSIAIMVAIISAIVIYLTGNQLNNTSTSQQQAQSSSFSSSTSSISFSTSRYSSSSSPTSSSFSDSEQVVKLEQEKREREEKERLERELKAAEERRLAEEKQLIDDGEHSVKILEDNQVTENIAPAQDAVNKIIDESKKAELQHRINLVQNAISQRAEQARQAQEVAAQQSEQPQQQAPVSSGGYFKDYRGRWHRPNGQYASKAEIAAAGLQW